MECRKLWARRSQRCFLARYLMPELRPSALTQEAEGSSKPDLIGHLEFK